MVPRRQTAAAEAVQPPPADQPIPAAEATTAEPKRAPFPDVSEQKSVLISLEPDGAKLRLRRSHKFNQMQIGPDGDLPDWARERLKADGWRDRVEDEGIYTKQLPPRAKSGESGQEPPPPAWPAVIQIERFFEQLVNDIRAERKMPPVRLGTAATRTSPPTSGKTATATARMTSKACASCSPSPTPGSWSSTSSSVPRRTPLEHERPRHRLLAIWEYDCGGSEL